MKRGYQATRQKNKQTQKFIIARALGGVAFVGIAATVVVTAGLIAIF